MNALGAIRGTVDDYERWARELGCPGWGWPEMLDGVPARRGRSRLRRRRSARQGRTDPAVAAPVRRAAAARPSRCARRWSSSAIRSATTITRPTRPACSRMRADAARRPARLHERRVPRAGTGATEPRGARRRARRPGAASTGGARPACARLTGEEIAGREVIVSAGAIHSPAILLRSGVGVDDGLPVGANLKEHAATPGLRDRAEARGPDAVGRRAGVQLDAALLVGPGRCRPERHADDLVRRRRARRATRSRAVG